MSEHAGRLLELRIEKPVLGGAGLARHQGRVVFVEGALPGSTVLGRVLKEEANCLRAVAQEVLDPSPEACRPACPHFGACGGCTWQNAVYPAQLAWKRDMAREQLARLGGVDIPLAVATASPLTLGYRNKMEFAFGGGPVLGLRRRGEASTVLEVRHCLLLPEPGMDILAAVRDFAGASGLPAYSARTGAGVWRHVVLRRSEASGRWLVQVIVGPKADPERLKPLGQALLRDFPLLAGVVLGVRKDRSEYAQAERRAWTLGCGEIEEVLDGLRFRVSAEAFFQTNTRAAALLYRQAVDMAGLAGGEPVWDLYCGVGGLSLFLARRAGRVTGFEANARAVADARANAALNALANCEFVAGDLKAAMRRGGGRPRVLTLDPPRAGLHRDNAAFLCALGVERLVYVSCNPATLARDLARLAPIYRVEGAACLDLFPHTPHVECVVGLVRR